MYNLFLDITCPDDIDIYTNSSGASVSWKVTGDHDCSTYCCYSYSPFNIDANKVTCKTEKNRRSCTFDVNVVGKLSLSTLL